MKDQRSSGHDYFTVRSTNGFLKSVRNSGQYSPSASMAFDFFCYRYVIDSEDELLANNVFVAKVCV